jgi:transcriptional regulator with XRE-family HTH domain
MREDIIKAIEGARKLKKLGVKEMCEACGVDRVSYWRFVSKGVSMDIDKIGVLMKYLGVEYLFYRK